MRTLLFLPVLFGFILIASGCADRPEVAPSAYGTVLEALPALKDAEEPFAFPVQDGNDHKNCVFDEMDFM